MSDLGTTTDAGGPLLEVTDLVKHFPIKSGLIFDREVDQVRAVDGISFTVNKGETLGLVGESGSGKSTACRAVLQLTAPTSGSVKFEGREIAGLGRRELRPLRREIQMIFQDPYASLNPRKRVGQIVGDQLKVQKVASGKELRTRVEALLERVGLSPEHYNRFPHEFSGGQRQRIGIARALALEPKLVFCDEPVSALDVSIQAQILDLIQDLNKSRGLATILITHDLGVVAEVADRVLVMYGGKVVERGTLDDIFYDPQHPYTWGLLGSLTRIDQPRPHRLPQISGAPPSLLNLPGGCAFRPRCPHEFGKCKEVPGLEAHLPGDPNHRDRCWLTPEQKQTLRVVEGRIGLEEPK